jgi:hypothetical protein
MQFFFLISRRIYLVQCCLNFIEFFLYAVTKMVGSFDSKIETRNNAQAGRSSAKSIIMSYGLCVQHDI